MHCSFKRISAPSEVNMQRKGLGRRLESRWHVDWFSKMAMLNCQNEWLLRLILLLFPWPAQVLKNRLWAIVWWLAGGVLTDGHDPTRRAVPQSMIRLMIVPYQFQTDFWLQNFVVQKKYRLLFLLGQSVAETTSKSNLRAHNSLAPS